MSKFENNMEDLFDIEVESTAIEPSKPVPPTSDKDDQTKDYEYIVVAVPENKQPCIRFP